MEHTNPHQTSSTRQETWRFFQKYSWHRVAFTLVLIAMLGTFIAIPGCGGGSSLSVIILGEGFPAAQIWIDRAVVSSGSPLTMFGQGSDVDGGTLSYDWDFEDDGTFDSTVQNPSTTYTTPGTYTVRLQVTDDEGNTSDATASVMVIGISGPAGAPAVVVRAFTLHLRADGEVTFCAEAEDAIGSPVASFAFDFTDDGIFDQTGASGTATNIYSSNGEFTCRVRVTDNVGMTSDATVVIVLCTEPYPDDPPSAMIVVPGGTLATDPTTPIEFKAIGSDIDGGAVTSIAWDFNDDGIFTDATGREVSSTFPLGQNRVRVRITDNDGNPPSEAEVSVVSAGIMGGPGIGVGAFADAVHASVGTVINFHCLVDSPSSLIDTISWDFDGDGIVDSTTLESQFAFALPGVYIPRCVVTNVAGESGASDVVVVIEDCEGSLGPYFWWDCLEEPTIYHGGFGRLLIGPGVSVLGGDPQQYQILRKIGPLGALCPDPTGALLIVEDHLGNVLPTNAGLGTGTPTPLVNTPGAAFSPFDIYYSGTIDGPPCIYCYTVVIRLVDPGIRVQVLKCVVCVIHDWFYGTITGSDLGGGGLGFDFSVGLQAQPLNSAAQAPPVYDLEIIYDSQTPEWNYVDFLAATLPTGWSAEELVNGVGDPIGVRFFTSTNPILPGGAVLDFQNLFAGTFPDTTGDSIPDLPQELLIELSDENGQIIGAEILQIFYP